MTIGWSDRDGPSGYAGVARCSGKHDRPWKERPISGTVCPMTASGLKRKFDPERSRTGKKRVGPCPTTPAGCYQTSGNAIPV
ncbi:hypothetical protein CUJ86_08230 [Methanofollis fontis]|uniref:Uncharacterized protein n=1 Tax=Methanofollis fontis TaxID=2052832 RepID=A0A483CS76_9EURY|nr:hypothetical protein CUJ86_08230 [Methanofollis fontis]